MRILIILILALAFAAVSAVCIYLTYQLVATYFDSHLGGLIVAGLLLLSGSIMVMRDLRG